jgi:hypothetical protein
LISVSNPQRFPEKQPVRRSIERFVLRDHRIRVICGLQGDPALAGYKDGPNGTLLTQGGSVMLKIFVLATAASFAMLSVASAADMPRKQPPPPAAGPIGKYPVGKFPIGKYPGKYPVAAKA